MTTVVVKNPYITSTLNYTSSTPLTDPILLGTYGDGF